VFFKRKAMKLPYYLQTKMVNSILFDCNNFLFKWWEFIPFNFELDSKGSKFAVVKDNGIIIDFALKHPRLDNRYSSGIRIEISSEKVVFTDRRLNHVNPIEIDFSQSKVKYSRFNGVEDGPWTGYYESFDYKEESFNLLSPGKEDFEKLIKLSKFIEIGADLLRYILNYNSNLFYVSGGYILYHKKEVKGVSSLKIELKCVESKNPSISQSVYFEEGNVALNHLTFFDPKNNELLNKRFKPTFQDDLEFKLGRIKSINVKGDYYTFFWEGDSATIIEVDWNKSDLNELCELKPFSGTWFYQNQDFGDGPF